VPQLFLHSLVASLSILSAAIYGENDVLHMSRMACNQPVGGTLKRSDSIKERQHSAYRDTNERLSGVIPVLFSRSVVIFYPAFSWLLPRI
jgi:hypothetical protein